MTRAEAILWKNLRMRRFPYKIRRQVPIGIYVADFLCMEARLVIEIDGPIHAFQQQYDLAREEILRSKGFRILRFTNDEVYRDRRKVLSSIEQVIRSLLESSSALLETRPPSPGRACLPVGRRTACAGEGPGVR